MLKKIFAQKNKKKFIFMDYASGTPVDKKVFKKMKPFFTNNFFNAGAIYQEGFDVREVLDHVRAEIAKAISARPQEIIFTDGGTEANNLVLRGLVSHWREKNNNKKPHIITTQIEHASVIETCRDLEIKELAEVSYLSVNEYGSVDSRELKKLIKENTILVSVGYVNGEIGLVQNIREIAKMIRHYRKHQKTLLPYFHTDAVQAVNHFNVNVQKLGVDFMTINASKIYGPKKIGALYKKVNIEIDAIITGGSQEFGLHAGTENISSIVGFAEALKMTDELKSGERERLERLRTFMESLLRKKMNLDFVVNGEGAERAPHMVNISIPDISSEEIILRLNAFGIKASMKSACKSGEYGDSHVIKALRDNNTQSIRFSFGRDTTKNDIEYVVDRLVVVTDNMQKTFDLYLS